MKTDKEIGQLKHVSAHIARMTVSQSIGTEHRQSFKRGPPEQDLCSNSFIMTLLLARALIEIPDNSTSSPLVCNYTLILTPVRPLSHMHNTLIAHPPQPRLTSVVHLQHIHSTSTAHLQHIHQQYPDLERPKRPCQTDLLETSAKHHAEIEPHAQ